MTDDLFDGPAGVASSTERTQAKSPLVVRTTGKSDAMQSHKVGEPGDVAPKIATIGVYGFDGLSFVQRLRSAEVAVLLDVRQRRGVRGPQYAWANSRRLQSALAEAGIGYLHLRELAPTTELRQLQYAEDDRLGVGKRSRYELAAEYVRRYTSDILDYADLASIVSALPKQGLAALLCVECRPEACHRSLIAQRLRERHGFMVEHLLLIAV